LRVSFPAATVLKALRRYGHAAGCEDMTADTDSLPAGALAAAAILEQIDEAVCALDRDRTITLRQPSRRRDLRTPIRGTDRPSVR
jgi:hypothetical protein